MTAKVEPAKDPEKVDDVFDFSYEVKRFDFSIPEEMSAYKALMTKAHLREITVEKRIEVPMPDGNLIVWVFYVFYTKKEAPGKAS